MINRLKLGMNFTSIGNNMGRSRVAMKKRVWKVIFEYYQEYDYNNIITKYNIIDRYDKSNIKWYCDHRINHVTVKRDIEIIKESPVIAIPPIANVANTKPIKAPLNPIDNIRNARLKWITSLF